MQRKYSARIVISPADIRHEKPSAGIVAAAHFLVPREIRSVCDDPGLRLKFAGPAPAPAVRELPKNININRVPFISRPQNLAVGLSGSLRITSPRPPPAAAARHRQRRAYCFMRPANKDNIVRSPPSLIRLMGGRDLEIRAAEWTRHTKMRKMKARS
ncbi:hypothetical protein EVAR_101111_1 [Eumeta japonica]|uniref:Uncharacterized protein n=1 Tax=Eumeta variegata TaxID=151549 RepID=A0A4C2A7Z1_EUMVA|nr:hypothetical protein EVAR_101111_1 [Eumeta japonica]